MPGHSASSPLECRNPGTLVSRTDSTYSPFCSYSAITRPAGVSSRSTPGVFGRTSPCSTATVTVPMVPCPHIGRQPEVSMNRMPMSQSGRVGG